MTAIVTKPKAYSVDSAAFGGAGWQPRVVPLAAEMGSVWGAYGVGSEWTRLKAVLLHKPGAELDVAADPDAAQYLDCPDTALAAGQHDAMAAAYRAAGVAVSYVDPPGVASPNQMFVADLMFMTSEGVILARPASTVRAGEERWVARRLTDLGIPVLRSIRGTGTFEGADAMWLDEKTLLVGLGLRTNAEGAAQIASLMAEMGVETIQVSLAYGSMHLMGSIRIVDRDLALVWPGRAPFVAVQALRSRGYQVAALPDESEIKGNFALNIVTLGPREILMPAGNPVTQRFYEDCGIVVHAVEMRELHKASGGIGCLTGILAREPIHP
jgi:N-dimethylarginine dimethylaminohydrolase